MNLHEYQAKALLRQYGFPLPNEILATTIEEVVEAYTQLSSQLGTHTAVVKAQIHAGGRGKAGGVRVVESLGEAREYASSLLGQSLVTPQTDEKGQPIHALLISENLYPVEKEFYLGATLDRENECITFMVSTEGGMEIEEVAKTMPDKIFKIALSPLVGLRVSHARNMGYHLGLNESQLNAFIKMVQGAYKAFIEHDLALLEINPLSVLRDGRLMTIDAKIAIDDNARFRQPHHVAEQDRSQENRYELMAAEYNLSYVSLGGNIGCMVNGAGLAMATMDIIQFYGATPANFLDVGGGATEKAVLAAFKLILSDPKVEAILVNIFGGIVRCDMIAEAIINAMEEGYITRPIVVRLAGNHAEDGLALIDRANLPIIVAEDLADAAQKVIEATGNTPMDNRTTGGQNGDLS